MTGPANVGAAAAQFGHDEPAADPSTSASAVLSMRMGLLLGCGVSVAIAAAVGDPAPYLTADPELARLLRGMAVLKGLMSAPATDPRRP